MHSEVNSVGLLKVCLREAVSQCSARGLYFAAKWAAETLDGLPEESLHHSTGPSLEMGSRPSDTEDSGDSFTNDTEYDKYLLAKSHFDVKEFDRAAYVLEKSTSAKSRFLKIYSKYLAGEKRKEEESNDIMGPLDDPKAVNEELTGLQEQLQKWCDANEMDGFLLYLYGLIKKQLNQKVAATELFLKSVHQYPYNWSAWLELSHCFSHIDMVKEITHQLPQNLMSMFFRLHLAVELNETQNNFYSLLSEFSNDFSKNIFLKTQKAIVHYNNREFIEAEREFDDLIQLDPYRLDDMDIYSNVLYVMDKRAKLSFLAHMSATTDKYRSETMCIIGNYYSLKAEREKAISYFKRALQVNRQCLTAWTLMGHEYVELKNTHAAVVAYKRALEVNPRDYRAWFGLGQTYQCLKMDFYAIYYYQRATVLRPNDARMWEALAGLFETVTSPEDSIKCYERALGSSDCDDTSTLTAMSKLAKLYEPLNKARAATYHEMILEREDLSADADELRNAHRFLAYFKRDIGDLGAAAIHARDLMDYGGSAREEGRSLINDLTNREQAMQQPPSTTT